MRATQNKLIKIISVTIATILAVALIPPVTVTKAAEIDGGTCGDNLTWTLDDKGILTISGSGEMEDYYKQEDDPSPWYSYSDLIKIVFINEGTTSIGDYAFYNCNSLTSVEISSSVTSIGYAAFYGCSNLTSIAIPSRLTSIGILAFANCSSLTSIAIPSGVLIIGAAAFGGCSNLTSIAIPSGVTSIEERTFYGCRSLTSVKIPSNVASIGNYAFYDCSNLTSVEIPSSVTNIGEEAFGDCSSLTSIAIPSGVTSIGNGAFWGCSSLTSIAIPSRVTSIGDGVFCDCSSLTSVGIPSNVTSIGNGAFQGCSSLTSIAIPSGVTSIGVNAFQECSSLTSMKIPSSVTSIGDDTFWGCSNLTSVEIPSSVTSIGVGAFGECSSLTSVEIPSSVTSIGDVAFEYCSSLTSIAIPSGVTTIEVGAFRECSSLISVEIPSSVTSIGAGAFWGCSNLTSIAIPSGVTSIGSSAFRDCSSLTSVEIPSSVTSIGGVAFGYCSSLTSIAIPSGVTSIENYTFYECSNLTSVELPSSVTSIGDDAFGDCSSLTSIAIPSGVTSIGSSAFRDCSSLTSIEIPSSVTSIGDVVFEDCSSLASISVAAENPVYDSREECNAIIETSTNKLIFGCMNTIIPSSVTSIGDDAFWGCSNLISIEIPSGVTSIGEEAFWGCSNLTSISVAAENPVYDSREECNAIIETSTNKLIYGCIDTIIPSSVTSIRDSAFGGCSNLTSIEIPSSVTSIGSFAFANCYSLISIAIPSGVTNIEYATFWGCPSLTSVEIPSSVTSIGFGAFCWCNGLKDITIPNSVTEIGKSAFYGCGSLIKIEIPDSVTSIGSLAFRGCRSLKSIEIPNSVTDIGENAFLDSGIADVYFEGTEDEWNSLNVNDLETANLFTIEDVDDSLNLEITFIDMPGGVAVTISSIGNEIFYTLDGSIPCTASIPYEDTFIIDEPGEYFINARAFNLDEGQCSPVSTEYEYLEQSGRPEIHEQNGQVTITGEGDIYYSLDISEDPTTKSYKYTGPVSFDNTTIIKARSIESGKAVSDIIGNVHFAGTVTSLDVKNDTFQFDNQKNSFGYDSGGGRKYYIPEERYKEIFGNTIGRVLYEQWEDNEWSGSCYGMSVAALLFHRGFLNIDDYSDEADTVYDILKPGSPDSLLTRLIEKYQIAQLLDENMTARQDHIYENSMSYPSNKQRGEDLFNAITESLSGGDPVILILYNSLGGEHAVVPYRMTENRIYVYDSQYPGNDNRYISYRFNDKGILTFEYSNYNMWMSYDSLGRLMYGLEDSLQGSISTLFEDEESRILISLNSEDFSVTRNDGIEVTDYTKYGSTDLSETEGTLLSLPIGKYRIENHDTTLTEFTISAATDEDYHRITVHDPDAVIEVGERNGKVYFSVTSESKTEIDSSVMSGEGYKNKISLTSTYAELYSTTKRTVVFRTKATTAVTNNEEQELLNDEREPEYYLGAAVSPDAETGARLYREGEQYTLSTDITSLPDGAFNLTVFATGGNENTMLYVASYSGTGRMTAIKGTKMTAGKTRYPFSISKDAAEVKVFMLNADRALPLISNLTIR